MIIRDAAGQIVPFGKVHKQLVADFLYGTLPDWVEVVGTPTFEPLPDRGTITVTTPTTAGATAELKMKHLIDSSKVTAIAITLEALQFNGNIGISVQVGIKSKDSKAGITFFITLIRSMVWSEPIKQMERTRILSKTWFSSPPKVWREMRRRIVRT